MNLLRKIPPGPAVSARRMKPRPAASGPTAPCSVRAKYRPGVAGFTLIEIALVLVLIGILSTMALYTYRMMINKARMTQAKTTLGHLTKTEATYFSSNDRYTDNVVLLDFDPVKYDYYRISVVLDNDAKNYTGTATGIGIMAGDSWTVTKDGQLTQADNSAFR
jgi:prepilin-type N-terminal cleavage/methylation domain-containing protein